MVRWISDSGGELNKNSSMPKLGEEENGYGGVTKQFDSYRVVNHCTNTEKWRKTRG